MKAEQLRGKAGMLAAVGAVSDSRTVLPAWASDLHSFSAPERRTPHPELIACS